MAVMVAVQSKTYPYLFSSISVSGGSVLFGDLISYLAGEFVRCTFPSGRLKRLIASLARRWFHFHSVVIFGML